MFSIFFRLFFKAQEKKVKLEEKRKKLAAAAALLEGRNADGLVSDLASAFTFLFLCTALLFSASASFLSLLSLVSSGLRHAVNSSN